ADGRLGHPQRVGGPAEAAERPHREEGLHLPDLHPFTSLMAMRFVIRTDYSPCERSFRSRKFIGPIKTMSLRRRAVAGTVSARHSGRRMTTNSHDANGGDDGCPMWMRTRGAERAGALRLFRLRHDVLPRLHHSPGIRDLLPRLRGVAAGDGGRARGRSVRAPLRTPVGGIAMSTACHCGMTLEPDRQAACAEWGTTICASCSLEFDATTYCRWCASTTALRRSA